MTPDPGTTLLHYRILEKIGEGGMGAVYRARDTKLDRDIALKILPAEVALDADRRMRFEREAKAVAALNHPGIVTLFAIEEDAATQTRFLTMELVDGRPLDALIPVGGLPLEQVLETGAALAEALAAAHRAGVVHRDLKPANVMVARDGGRVKVLDFGLAKLNRAAEPEETTQLAAGLTQEGRVMGTPHYMSPEQVKGSAVDSRTDLYAMGVVLFEMATGQKPFSGKSTVEVMSAVLRDPPPSLAELRPELPERLGRVVARCLEKRREDRVQTAEELREELRACTGAKTVAVGTAPTTDPAPAGRAKAGSSTGKARTPSDPDRIEALAVMPFENGSKEEEIAYLCDGLAESLIATLSRIPDLRVMSRHASFALREEPRDIRVLGERLGVDALVLGDLRPRGDRMVVNVELVGCPDGRHLWGERYDQPLSGAAEVERDVTENVARKLKEALSTEEIAELTRGPDSQAYLLYLKGRSLLIGSASQMKSAAEYLEEATRIDPDYALAYAAMAESYLLMAYHGLLDPEEARRRARKAARTAVRLGPELPEAYTAAGSVAFMADWDWEGAEEMFLQAIAMGGRDGPHLEYADFLTGMDRLDEALETAGKARRLDPVSPNPTHLEAYTLLLMGEYERAIEKFKGAIALHPNWVWGHIKLSRTYSATLEHEKALAEVKIAEAALHGEKAPLAWAWLGRVYARAGHEERAREILATLQDTEEAPVEPLTRAFVHSGLGEKERVLEEIEEAYRRRSGLCSQVQAVGRLEADLGLREEPRFRAVVEKMGLG